MSNICLCIFLTYDLIRITWYRSELKPSIDPVSDITICFHKTFPGCTNVNTWMKQRVKVALWLNNILCQAEFCLKNAIKEDVLYWLTLMYQQPTLEQTCYSSKLIALECQTNSYQLQWWHNQKLPVWKCSHTTIHSDLHQSHFKYTCKFKNAC